jgi:hypothetical protein
MPMDTAVIIACVLAISALAIVAVAFGVKQEYKALALLNDGARGKQRVREAIPDN